MSDQASRGSKPDAGIQVKVCGHNLYGQHFEEIGAAFQTSKGVMIETAQQLREGFALEITNLLSNRKAIAHVKSIGPNLGASTLVFVEGADVENLWLKGSSKESERKRSDAAAEEEPGAGGGAGASLAVAERALAPLPKSSRPQVNRFVETLNDLVESVLDANLRPAVEQLSSEIPEHVIRAQNAALANLNEQIEAAMASFGSRLDARALASVTQNENLLVSKVQALTEEALADARSRQEEFRRHLDEALLAARQTLSQQAQEILSEKSAGFSELMRQELEKQREQFTEACRSQSEEKQNRLDARAQELESSLGERVAARGKAALEELSAALEKRAEQAMTALNASAEKRLQETGASLSESAQRTENDFAARLTRHANEIAERFHAQLEEKVEQDLTALEVRLKEQLALAAAQFHQSLMERIENELNEKRQKFARQAQFLMKVVAEQNRNRMITMLKEMARLMETQPAFAMEAPEAAAAPETAENQPAGGGS